MLNFQKAQRKRAKLRLALCGPSGSGKTFSALLIAKGIGGRVALIDTERGSGELYADNARLGLEYDTAQFAPPYTPQRAIEAITAAAAAGYSVVIFDSLSHIWMGEGGLLEMVDLAAKGNKGNSFAGWKNVRPHEKKLLEAITGANIHVIATMRTKTAWEIEKDERTGKTKPVKVGLKPEQREGLEYEFTVVFDLSVEGHVASASKDRTDLFSDAHFVPNEETGRQLLAWLESAPAEPAPAPAPAAQSQPAPAAQSGQAEDPKVAKARAEVASWVSATYGSDAKRIANGLTDLVGRQVATVAGLSVEELRKVYKVMQKGETNGNN